MLKYGLLWLLGDCHILRWTPWGCQYIVEGGVGNCSRRQLHAYYKAARTVTSSCTATVSPQSLHAGLHGHSASLLPRQVAHLALPPPTSCMDTPRLSGTSGSAVLTCAAGHTASVLLSRCALPQVQYAIDMMVVAPPAAALLSRGSLLLYFPHTCCSLPAFLNSLVRAMTGQGLTPALVSQCVCKLP
jgi:hypothetical protein